ncbi:MAG: cytochrome c biogenesis protein CcsA [Thermodesulfovibrionales bacterium]|nr:cytochrome c biogenesis protein CcsA [Thermodesulfovibrionales bacterium]
MLLLLYLSIPFYIAGLFIKRLLYGGVLLNLIYLFLRGKIAGRLPITGPHDTLVLLGAFTGMMILIFEYYRIKEKLPYALTALLASAFIFSALAFNPLNAPLPAVLKTLWFEIHVVTAFLAYALFGIGLTSGITFFKNKQPLMEEIQYRAILMGYSLFSFSMIGGGIWAYYAWGSYWLWTPKELWTTILWLFYSLYLHLRLKGQKWQRYYVSMGIAGFGVVLFTYLGVSLLMKSSHTF